MIMKKLLTIIACFWISINSAPLAASGFDGFYIGEQIGYVSSVCKDRHYITLLFEEEFKNTFGVKGSDIGGQVGWGTTWCDLVYAGIEGTALYVNARGRNDLNVITTAPFPPGLTIIHDQHAKILDSYQMAFRLGLPICDVIMPYVKVGYANTLWKIQDRHGDIEALSGLKHVVTKKKRLNGFVASFGADFLLCPHLIFGLEFDYSFYRKQTLRLGSDTPPSDTAAVMEFTPRYVRAGAKLSYLF